MNQIVSPHPIERVINQVQNFNSPLAVAFVAHAIRFYQQEVNEMPAEHRAAMDRGFVSYDAWAQVGQQLIAGLDAIHM